MSGRNVVSATMGVVFLSGLLGLTAPDQANATLVSFEFKGAASAGTVLDLGSGPIDVGGLDFVLTGMTTSDTDLTGPGDGVGQFGAVITVDFGIAGTFQSDGATDVTYFQNCESPVAFDCVGLSRLDGSEGFNYVFSPAVNGDPDSGGIPIGSSLVPDSINSSPFFNLANSLGHTLSFDGFERGTSPSVSVTAKADEPAAFGLLALGMLTLTVARRRTGRLPARGSA